MRQVAGKVLLLGVTFDSGNMGVGALAASAVEVLGRKFGNDSVVLLDYGDAFRLGTIRVNGGRAEIGAINLRFSWKLFLPNNVFALIVLACLCRLPFLRRRIVCANTTLRAIDEATAAFALSGGDSFSDIYGFERFLYVSLPIWLTILMGKELVLLPQTIGPFNDYVTRQLARNILRRAARTYSRDAMGVEIARSMIGKSTHAGRAKFAYDLAFVLPARRPEEVRVIGRLGDGDANWKVVGLNVSGLLMMGGYDRRNMFGLKVSYQELVDALIRYFCERPDVQVLLVPHVFGDHPESDQAACRTVYDECVLKYPGKIRYIASAHDQHEIKYLIGQCDFFIGARMHACIAALSQCVPTIGIAYSDKISGVMETVGARQLVVDPRTMTLEDILDAVVHSFADRQQLASALQSVMAEVRRRVFTMLDDPN